ncbi:hypothetical protein JNB11_02185 [Kocuria palustris]|nr:hypothetical protein [Kocuria palustris]
MELVEFNLPNILELVRNELQYKKPRNRCLPELANDESCTTINAELVTIFDERFEFSSPSPVALTDYTLDLPRVQNIYEFHTTDIRVKVDADNLLVRLLQKRKQPNTILLLFTCPNMQVKPSSDGSLLMHSLRQVATLLMYSLPRADRNDLIISDPELFIRLDPETESVHIAFHMILKARFTPFKALLPDAAEKVKSIAYEYFEADPLDDDGGNAKFSRDFTTNSEEVTAQLFYLAVSAYTAQMTPVPADHFNIPELETELLPFQRTTVEWMLRKENVRFDKETSRCKPIPLTSNQDHHLLDEYLSGERVNLDLIDRLLLSTLAKLSFGWERVKYGAQPQFYFNKYTAQVVSRKSAALFVQSLRKSSKNWQHLPAQGLLAEEMGLGKTVEVAATILMNKRPEDEVLEVFQYQHTTYGKPKTVIKARTTLIIAPELILKQWVLEMERLAPLLAVTVYKGIGEYPKLGDLPALIAEYLRRFDVVFTTYQTISRELDHAKFSSQKRTTRNSIKEDEKYSQYFTGKRPRLDEEPVNLPEVTEEDEDEKALELYRDMFQILISLIKPSVANQRLGNPRGPTDYEKALQDEIEAAITHNRIPEIYKLKDHELPLMLSQFWRVILDEVQMVSSKVSRAFQSAALIPRFHAWGVSGTPMKKLLQDLHLILQFLRYSPFNGDAKKAWECLVSYPHEFVQLWTTVAIRHTKAMVHNDIQLPPQQRVVMTREFLAVEQELYNQMFEECLSTLCMDINGNPVTESWESTPLMLMYMRLWLQRLRQHCGLPQIGNLHVNLKRYKRVHTNMVNVVQQLSSLDKLLEDMLAQSLTEINDDERQIINLFTDIAEFFEFVFMPRVALKFLKVGATQVEKILYRLQAQLEREVKKNEDSRANGSRLLIRLWRVILHKFLFLIGSAHFQLYDPDYLKLTAQHRPTVILPQLHLLDYSKKSHAEIICELAKVPLDKLKLASSAIDVNISADDARNAEYEFYERAEDLRRELLSLSMANVEQAVRTRLGQRKLYFNAEEDHFDYGATLFPKEKNRAILRIPIMKFDAASCDIPNYEVKVIVDQTARLVEQLNREAVLINQWVQKLVETLKEPLVGATSDPSGKEFEQLLVDQDKVQCLLVVLDKMLAARKQWIYGIEETETKRPRRKETPQVDDDQYLASLEKSADEVRPVAKVLLQEMVEALKVTVTENVSSDQLSQQLGVFLENQKAALALVTRELTVHCNAVFNARIEYFKQLQQISDSVKDTDWQMSQSDLTDLAVSAKLTLMLALYLGYEDALGKLIGRFRYLNSLFVSKDALKTELEEQMMCVICRGVITIGLLTACGHKYCKDCLSEWLHAHSKCPMCNRLIQVNQVYNFTHTKPELKAQLVEDVGSSQKDKLYLIYKPLPKDQIAAIDQMQLKNQYSTKVDMIVRQVLYLRSKDPQVQIVIFLQWQDMLYILGTAFRANDITFLGSFGALVPDTGMGRPHKRYDPVEQFKAKDSNITCFLLNARAQASGLTLVNATHVFLCEPLVNTLLELQAILRIHRIGQTKPTSVWMFVIENTVEELIAVMAANRRLEYLNSGRNNNTESNADEQRLTEAESMVLMNSEGIDAMVLKRSTQGETVLNVDLWHAFFAARTQKQPIAPSTI